MTNDRVTELAKLAGFEKLGENIEDWVCFTDELHAFAEMVRNETLEEVANACQSWGNASSVTYIGASCRPAASRILGMKS